MEDKLKIINKSSTLKCPKCGRTVHVSEKFDFGSCLIQLHAKCSYCDYKIDSQREGTLNEIRKEAGLEPIEEVKVDELLTNPEPNSATSTPGVDIRIPMCYDLKLALKKAIEEKGPQVCGFCGGHMDFGDVNFTTDNEHIEVAYTCPKCGRICYKHRSVWDYAIFDSTKRVLPNGDIVSEEEAKESGQYPCEDSDCIDYKAEYEKLCEKNKELEHQIEIYIKVLEEKEENCKHCVRPDYASECEKLREEREKLREECESLRRQKADLKRQNEHHCRALMLIRDLIDII